MGYSASNLKTVAMILLTHTIVVPLIRLLFDVRRVIVKARFVHGYETVSGVVISRMKFAEQLFQNCNLQCRVPTVFIQTKSRNLQISEESYKRLFLTEAVLLSKL